MENFVTMEKNYGNMEGTMVLWTKLWYYTGTMELQLTKEKNMVDYPKLRKFDF